MPNPMSCLNFGRVDSAGAPVEPQTSKGVMWAVISAVVILAAAILLVVAAGNLALAGFAFSAGAILPGVLQIGAAIMTGLAIASLGMIAAECIKNAHHHLRHRRRSVFHFSM